MQAPWNTKGKAVSAHRLEVLSNWKRGAKNLSNEAVADLFEGLISMAKQNQVGKQPSPEHVITNNTAIQVASN